MSRLNELVREQVLAEGPEYLDGDSRLQDEYVDAQLNAMTNVELLEPHQRRAPQGLQAAMSDHSYIKSWDDFVDALGSMPVWAQYRNQLRVQDIVKTHEQLNKLGVPYPHEELI
jgi:hypothetical protein